MSAAGAVGHAEKILQEQVHRAVGTASVTAYTDLYDQVYWTKKLAHAAPIGSLGNRLLAGTYNGMTFVQTKSGLVLGYHVSWHKPAAPLIDGLQALHADRGRHDWLTIHVGMHVLDRGTQGDTTLRWSLEQDIPYLTLSKGKLSWRRYAHPTHTTATGVPIFVRPDVRLADVTVHSAVRTAPPRSIVFPARPDKGTASGRAIRYRTAAKLSAAQIRTLDTEYKARWPCNENPIKALVAVGFGVNRDRTLEPTTSRGHDGKVARTVAAIQQLDAKITQIEREPTGKALAARSRLEKKRARRKRELKRLHAQPVTKGARSARGAELLCKVMTLVLYNAIALLLSRSAISAVRAMAPARVRELLLGRTALASTTAGTLTLSIEGVVEPTDRTHQEELARLFSAARLKVGGMRLTVRIRDPSLENLVMRIAA